MGILTRLWRDEAGATAVEYGLICAIVVLTAMAGASVLGNTVSNTLFGASNQLTNAQ
ncbi:Flp family type IVb pilin [Novosphingobium sp. HBC54]|uniref:Flp family type IVb pilin n=1 Tax=Novosphingobium cyanobacteriorum TaxID=3024215 RepID=A0ABT6CMY8_9SPHN|nr:Flp family type IVb pilin [Novosphingobium cyanobacteriorum]MDF8334879.1 Flp family type IVb pilin [Novosphingobium cyanobacteriorum]